MRAISSHIKVFARAHSLKSAKELLDISAKYATPEIIESSFTLGSKVLANVGLSENKINSLMDYLREDNYANVGKPLGVK